MDTIAVPGLELVTRRAQLSRSWVLGINSFAVGQFFDFWLVWSVWLVIRVLLLLEFGLSVRPECPALVYV